MSSRYLLAPALSMLASFYAAADSTRRFLYRHGVLWPTPLPSPVISIGNLTDGGTGKTPFVEYMARSYLQVGRVFAWGSLQVQVNGSFLAGRKGVNCCRELSS